mmetsp:Transcript_5893/g.6339  ORF Transcript_5893/g.6339 Transcript_5893/m.6339 type:complete len:95 (+) Transcript_5893:846-1130(+)
MMVVPISYQEVKGVVGSLVTTQLLGVDERYYCGALPPSYRSSVVYYSTCIIVWLPFFSLIYCPVSTIRLLLSTVLFSPLVSSRLVFSTHNSKSS